MPLLAILSEVVAFIGGAVVLVGRFLTFAIGAMLALQVVWGWVSWALSPFRSNDPDGQA